VSEPANEREWEARRAIEAVVLATTEPIEAGVLAQLVERRQDGGTRRDGL
jgi:chromosome segregation and condensation protein ScpB